MKPMKFLLTAALVVMAADASAQFTNGGGTTAPSAGTGAKLTKDCSPYNRFYVSYNPQTIKYDSDNAEDMTLAGFTAGYTHAISVSRQIPLFVELGARFNYSFKTQDLYEAKTGKENESDVDYGDAKNTYMSLAVPVNLAYKLTLPNGKASITPFAGLTFKYNLKAGCDYDPTKKGKEEFEYGDTKLKYKDFFDKKDMGSKNATWSRFQAGWQIGVGLSYEAFYLGVHYGADFGELAKKTTSNNFGLSVGVNF